MLDDDQARVVAHEDGPAAVLAGAGSGKTRCTTERAARRLTESGVPADGLLLLTFTNKAAGEMRARLAQRLPSGQAAPRIGTFHSFGNQLLRSYGRRIDIPPSATLMDADDAARMLDALMAEPFPDKGERQGLLRLREQTAAHGLDVTHEADVPALMALCDDAGLDRDRGRRFRSVLRRYEEEKRRAGVLDFADLILLPLRLLRQETELAQQLREQLRDVTVDEAQDTDAGQFRLLRAIAPESGAVVLVGDDDQAIYEWRHARPQNLRDFIEGFDATVYRLERNYRSTDAIVSSGAHLVRNNVQRLDKAPFAVRSGEAAPVTLVEYDDGDAMADGVVERLAASLARGRTPDDLAVLYRKNRLGRGLEAALLRQGIPYRIKAGTDLLGYADVRMMLAVGRLAANRRDLRALARVADLVPGLGARSVARLSAGRGDPLEGAARLAPRASAAVERLSAGLERLRQRGPGGLAEWCQRDSLFRGWLLRRARRGQAGQGDEEALLRPALGRMAVVQRAMDRRLATLPTEAPVEARWAAALEVVATGTDEADETEGRVTLSTVHGAKGLEWPEVHVYGFSEGLMPMAREGEIDNLTEERRLAYVALTRAQDAAVLHHADALDLGTGQGREAMTLSRFVGELGPDDALCRTDRRRGHAPTADASEWLAAMRRAVDGG